MDGERRVHRENVGRCCGKKGEHRGDKSSGRGVNKYGARSPFPWEVPYRQRIEQVTTGGHAEVWVPPIAESMWIEAP